MTFTKEYGIKKTLVARLLPGEDILESLEALVMQYDVQGGQINFIGAIGQAVLGYFDRHESQYKHFTINEGLEVTSGMGNVSRLEDGTPVVHAHMVVGDEKGKSYSGHLMKGCTVSVTIEIVMQIFDVQLTRSKDEATGLNLLNLQ